MRPALAFALAVTACASPAARAPDNPSAGEQFEKLTTLVGTWKTTPESPMQGTVAYRLVGSGSTLVETLGGGTPHEMVTMYHLDGSQLVLTHYCSARNQPRMRAVPSEDTSEIRFEFVALGNGDWRRDMHMHEVVLRFGDDGHFRPEWQGWKNGKPESGPASMDFVRAE